MAIIQTALTNKALPLELEYREPSRDAEMALEEPLEMGCVETGEPPASMEFRCLLDVI